MTKRSLSDRQKGMICIILSAFCFAWMNAFVRLSGDLPFIQKSFFRNLVALLFALAMLLREHGCFLPKKGSLPFLVLRATAGTLGILCNFYAIDHLALSDASILNKMSPFFAILCSWIFLREKLNWKQGLIVLGAFVGALCVIKPTFANADLFPSLTDKEVRTILGAYLFKGKDGAKRVDDLSGGEKARLVLAELLQSRPNFLILDEPTNHMDIQAKETLESAFQAYEGTILFVSHDRYFIRQVAKSVLIFENNAAFYYPFGYEHYLERKEKEASGEPLAARIKAEEQALIEGLKAVPRAERHRLREIPEEEAYDQWRLRLAAEAIENAAEQTEEIWQQILEKNGKREEWELEHWDQWLNEIADKNEDAACGEKQEKQAEEELSAFTEQYENAQSAWTDACLFWYDIWCEAHPEPVMDPGTSDTDGSVPQDTESSKTDGSEI